MIDQSQVNGSILFGIGSDVSGLRPGQISASVLLELAIIIPCLIALVFVSLAYDRIQR